MEFHTPPIANIVIAPTAENNYTKKDTTRIIAPIAMTSSLIKANTVPIARPRAICNDIDMIPRYLSGYNQSKGVNPMTKNKRALIFTMLDALLKAQHTYDNITSKDFSLGKDKEARDAIDNAISEANFTLYGIEPKENHDDR